MDNRFVMLLVLLLLAALPLSAQAPSVELSVMAVYADVSAGDLADEGELEFESEVGYGAAAALFFGERISLELAASQIEPEGTLRFTAPPTGDFVIGDIKMTPVSLVLQYHFAPMGPLDVYVGAGAGYVMFGDAQDSPGLDDLGLSGLDLDDSYGYVGNAGLSFGLTGGLRLKVDAKYFGGIETDSRVTFADDPSEESDPAPVEFSPLLVSAGLSFRF